MIPQGVARDHGTDSVAARGRLALRGLALLGAGEPPVPGVAAPPPPPGVHAAVSREQARQCHDDRDLDAADGPSLPPPRAGTTRPAGRFRSGHHALAMGTAYELLDVGDGRRLERFGELIVDRPAADADEPPRDPAAWAGADLRLGRDRGWRSASGDVPIAWEVEDGDLRFELRPTPTGQVGLFPEQAPNRAWVRDVIAALPEAPAVLNLFAYSGAMTLSAAAAGASVTHVDGARPAVAWARRNAQLSGLTDRPIRWIVDDVEGFVAREARRGRRYDGLVLDPPSYGHGAGGRAWRLSDRLPWLLAACADLTGPRPAFVVLTATRPGSGRIGSPTRSRPRSIDGPRTSTRATWACGRGAGRTCGWVRTRASSADDASGHAHEPVEPAGQGGRPSPRPARARDDRPDDRRRRARAGPGARRRRRGRGSVRRRRPRAGDEARGVVGRLAGTVGLTPVSEPVLAKIAFGDRSDGVVAIVRTPPTDLARLALGTEPLVVVVEAVEKPGNLGRSCERPTARAPTR